MYLCSFFFYLLLFAMELIIATYNVNGIADPTKRRAVFEFLTTVQAELIPMQETHV